MIFLEDKNKDVWVWIGELCARLDKVEKLLQEKDGASKDHIKSPLNCGEPNE